MILKSVNGEKEFTKEESGLIEKADKEKGTFEGILIKGSVLDSYGDYFTEESINNFKTKDGTTTIFLLHQHDKTKEIGTMEIYAENGDLRFKAQLDLSKDDNGNYINKEAAKVYSLMKQGAKYDMSVGGSIKKGESGELETEKGIVRAYLIKEFEAWEGSTVIKGAVPGSVVESHKYFNDNNKEEKMEKHEVQELFERYKKEVGDTIKALDFEGAKSDISKETKGQIDKIKTDIEDKLKEFSEAFEENVTEKMNEFVREFSNIEQTKKELTDEDLEKHVIGFMKEVNSNSSTNIKKFSEYVTEKATATTNVPEAILPLLGRTILRRAQTVKNIWSYVSKFSMSEQIYKIPRELLGDPEVKFISETGARTETSINGLDQVEFELHQIYALPIFTNATIAHDVVGFVALVLERVAENFVKKISEKILYGTGTGEPFGILTDADVLANALEFKAAGLVDYDTITIAKYNLKELYAQNAVVVMNRKSAPFFINLKNSNGTPIFYENFKQGGIDMLSSIPVVYDDAMPTYETAAVGDPILLIGDLKRYLGVTHTNYDIRIEDRITQKGYTGYYFETMAGGNVMLPEAFVPIKKK